MTVFDAYSAYYDLLNADKDYAGEADYVANLLRESGSGPALLELGCGTGVHASLLAERGFDLVSVDRSETMLAAASRRVASLPPAIASRLRFAQGDLCDFRAGRTFDSVISLFHVISYQTSQRDLEAALATAREHLAPGGTFVFDCWYGPAVLTLRPERRVRKVANEIIEVTRLAEPVMHANENVVDVVYDIEIREKATGSIERLRETHRMRYLFVPEVSVLLRNAGFELRGYEEWMTRRPADFDTWSVCFIAAAV